MKMAGSQQRVAAELERVVVSHIRAESCELLANHERAVQLTVAWLGYLRNAQRNGTANELLDGFQASLIETAGCLALGLVRPALFSMRAQVDILLAWLYFRDHRVEWEHLELTGEKFHLVSEVMKYLKTYDRRFQQRLGLLRTRRAQGQEDPYRLLSAHVHSQNSATLPPLVRIEQLVQSGARCLECVGLQEEISEYLSDVLTCWFVGQWADLPGAIKESIVSRIGPKKLKELCMQ